MLDAKIELLQQTPLFLGLSDEHFDAIAEAGQKTFFEAGETLIKEGESGDSAYLIMSGKAGCPRVEEGQILEEDLWPGTFVGELAMLVETTHSFSVTAKERLRALEIKRDAFRAVMEAHPEIAQHISEKLLVRLYGLAAELHEVDTRLAALEEAA